MEVVAGDMKARLEAEMHSSERIETPDPFGTSGGDPKEDATRVADEDHSDWFGCGLHQCRQPSLSTSTLKPDGVRTLSHLGDEICLLMCAGRTFADEAHWDARRLSRCLESDLGIDKVDVGFTDEQHVVGGQREFTDLP